jgi:hypothetical protein
LRRLPAQAAEVVHAVEPGVEATVLRLRTTGEGVWLRLRTPEGREGWLPDGDPAFDPYHSATIDDDVSELFEQPSDGSPRVVRMRKGSVVTVLRAANASIEPWVRVRMTSGREGYLRASTAVVWDAGVDGGIGPPPPTVSTVRVPGPHVFMAIALSVAGAVRTGVRLLLRMERRARHTSTLADRPRG